MSTFLFYLFFLQGAPEPAYVYPPQAAVQKATPGPAQPAHSAPACSNPMKCAGVVRGVVGPDRLGRGPRK